MATVLTGALGIICSRMAEVSNTHEPKSSAMLSNANALIELSSCTW